MADQAVGGNTFKGDSGQMITISGYNTADTIADFTGDGDERDTDALSRSRSARHEAALVHRPSRMGVDGEVFSDGVPGRYEAPDDYRGHLRHRCIGFSQQFLIASLSHPIEAKGVLKMEVDLTPYGAGDRDGPGVVGLAPRARCQRHRSRTS